MIISLSVAAGIPSGRGLCGNAQGVDVCLHQVSERLENHSLSLKGASVPESFRDDLHSEVALAVRGADVTPMPMALVDQFQMLRFKCGFQTGANLVEPVPAHGKTCLKGRTSTEA